MRLGDDHPVGRHHQPHRDALAVAQDLVHRDQVAHEPLDLGEHRARRAARRRGTRARAAAPRPAAAALAAEAPSRSHQRATSGNESSRSVSPVGAQSTIDARPSRPSSWWRLSCSRLNSSSHAGRDGQLLGRDAVHAALDAAARRASPAPRAQLRSSSSWAWHLLGPQAARRPASARRRPRSRSDVGERVRRVGREHERARARGGAAARGGGGDRGLADAALARVEDRPRAPSATRQPTQRARTSIRPATAPALPARSTARSAHRVARRAGADRTAKACAARSRSAPSARARRLALARDA